MAALAARKAHALGMLALPLALALAETKGPPEMQLLSHMALVIGEGPPELLALSH